MEPIELEIGYTTVEMPGRCAKCLAEEEYGTCMGQLLKGDDEKALKERFEIIRAFLTSPDLAHVRDESEKYLSDGKKVTILVHLEEGQLKYEVKVEEKIMRYGIPVTQGMLDPHFGHCESFALIDVDVWKKTITNQQIVASPGHQPGFLPVWLAEQGVNVVIAGGMGGRAVELFTERGVKVVMGAKAMDPQKAVLEHLKGNLLSSGSACEEHEHGCK